MEEKTLNSELEKWFIKWQRKIVTGRCLIELKQRDKQFIKEVLEHCIKNECHAEADFIKQKSGFK